MKLLKIIKNKLKKKTDEYAQKSIDELTRILNRPKEGEIVKIKNINVPYNFIEPKKEKLWERKQYYEKYGYFKSPIVLNENNLLINGYITYLLALNLGYEYITILRKG